MSVFSEYAFKKITEFNNHQKFFRTKNKNNIPKPANPNPNKGRWYSSMYCLYRINRDDLIKGTCWNSPRKRKKTGKHAEESFFHELEDALTVNANPTSVELIITRSPCYDQCWQIIKEWATKFPETKFSILFCGIYNPDNTTMAPREITFGGVPQTYFSMLQSEECSSKNIWIVNLKKPKNAADIERALNHAHDQLETKANFVMVIHPLAIY